jgi:branched-chain amino acid aminotransferase
VAADAALGLLEIVRVKRGRVELLGEHVRRLTKSARALGLPPPPTDPELRERVRATVARSSTRDGLLELRFARGEVEIEVVGGVSFGTDALAQGLALVTASFPRDEAALSAAHKTTDRRDFARARDDARRAGADEALLLNKAGRVACAAAANLFVLRDDGLVTPPVSEGALPGVMRAALLAAARSLGVPVREAPLTRADLAAAPDLLLTASAHGLLSVRSLDGALLEKPRRGSLQKGLVPRLRLRLHELCEQEELPEAPPHDDPPSTE